MNNVPKQYAWLLKLQGLPQTIVQALPLLGTKEVAGTGNNPTIMAWAKAVGEDVFRAYYADSVPWCGLWCALVMKHAGKKVVKDPLWALNWGTFGVHSPMPGLGDVLVFVRRTSTGAFAGHVGLYVAEDPTHYHVLGGNQNDSVTISRLPKSRLYTARRPAYTNTPAAVRPYQVAATGLVSTSEA